MLCVWTEDSFKIEEFIPQNLIVKNNHNLLVQNLSFLTMHCTWITSWANNRLKFRSPSVNSRQKKKKKILDQRNLFCSAICYHEVALMTGPWKWSSSILLHASFSWGQNESTRTYGEIDTCNDLFQPPCTSLLSAVYFTRSQRDSLWTAR